MAAGFACYPAAAGGCTLSLPVGNADMSFPGKPGKPEKLGTPIYGSQFRVLFGGSNRVQALPA